MIQNEVKNIAGVSECYREHSSKTWIVCLKGIYGRGQDPESALLSANNILLRNARKRRMEEKNGSMEADDA